MNNSILNVMGTLLMALNQWFQIILITQFIGIYEVGLYTYFLAITAPLVLLSRYSFSVILPTQRTYKYSYTIFYKYRIILNYLFLVLSIFLSFLLNLSIYENVCLISFMLFKFYETKEEFVYAENIAKSNIKFLAYSKIYKSIFTILIFTLIISLTSSLLTSISSLFLVQVIVYYTYDRKYLTLSDLKSEKLSYFNFKNILILGLGLTIVGVLSSFNANIPRYFLEYFSGREALGVYATILYFATVTNNIVIAINQTFIANLSTLVRESIDKFYRSFMKILIYYTPFLIFGFICLILFGENILSFIYGDYYRGYNFEIFLLGIQILLMVIFKILEMGLSVLNLYKSLSFLQLFTFILTLLFSFLLIIPYGIAGALLVSILAFLIGIIGQISIMLYYRINL